MRAQGAAGARNRLLEEAAPCDLVIFFDDDVAPAQGCVDAYVAACMDHWCHPEEVAFAGGHAPEPTSRAWPGKAFEHSRAYGSNMSTGR